MTAALIATLVATGHLGNGGGRGPKRPDDDWEPIIIGVLLSLGVIIMLAVILGLVV